ncbi:MAG: hypothetical protein HYR96_13735 [Deltaproteobacteria bacterium]|nr:hypothetical protein [Deltaproteobacteria bacterium]MBI3294720.1 hypothetical protein [Deltaproteobacteria bacterium]
MRLLSLVVTLLPIASYGYIPAVPALLKEVYSGRKAGASLEISLSHKVKISNDADPVVISERIIRNKNSFFIFFRSPLVEGVIPAGWNGKEYRLPENRLYPSDSKAFMRALLSLNGEELLPTLLHEEFLKRDQIHQYKTDFKFEGDPNLWNMKENTLIAPDASIKRTNSSTAYVFVGLVDGKNRRSVWIDRALKGIARLEWQSETGTTSWNFSNFASLSAGGYFPKTLTFETGTITLVESTLETAHALNANQLQEVKKSFEQAVKGHSQLPGALDGALKVLLSFR